MSASLGSKATYSKSVCFGGTISVEDFDEGGKNFDSTRLLFLTKPRKVYAGCLGSKSQMDTSIDTISIVEFVENAASILTEWSSLTSAGSALGDACQFVASGLKSSLTLDTIVTNKELFELTLEGSVSAAPGIMRLFENSELLSSPDMLELVDALRCSSVGTCSPMSESSLPG